MAVGRVAALYDVHGNLPALEAVLAQVEALAPDLVVVGGDVVWGPMPAEVLERLAGLEVPVRWVMGNADREVVEAYDHPGPQPDPDDKAQLVTAFAAARLSRAQRDLLASFEPVVRVDAQGLGDVLFCHGSPRSDTEKITRITARERLSSILEGVDADVVVCGHTHQQFDVTVDERRVVNAGSVGLPYEGDAAAFWLLLDGNVQLRRTAYDVLAALEPMRATGLPNFDEMVLESLTAPEDPAAVAELFEGEATGAI